MYIKNMKDNFQITTEVIKGECIFKLKDGHLFYSTSLPEEEITSKLVHREGLSDWNIEIYNDQLDSSKVFYLLDRSRGLVSSPKPGVAKLIEDQKDHPEDITIFLSCEIPIGSKCVSNENKMLLITDTILITDKEIDQYVSLR